MIAAKEGFRPRLPDVSDPMRTGVRWIGLSELAGVTLYPNISKQIQAYAHNRRNIDLIEDFRLESYKKRGKSGEK